MEEVPASHPSGPLRTPSDPSVPDGGSGKQDPSAGLPTQGFPSGAGARGKRKAPEADAAEASARECCSGAEDPSGEAGDAKAAKQKQEKELKLRVKVRSFSKLICRPCELAAIRNSFSIV